MNCHNIKIQQNKDEMDTYFSAAKNSYLYFFNQLLFTEWWDAKGLGGLCLGKENSVQLQVIKKVTVRAGISGLEWQQVKYREP